MSFDLAAIVADLRAALEGPLPSVRQIADRLEELPAAVLVADDAGRFIGANRRALELTGYSLDELGQRMIADITPSDELPAQERLWRSFERVPGHQRGHYTVARKDGSTVRVHYEAFRDVAPGIHVSFLLPDES